jgi:hypothetical protein
MAYEYATIHEMNPYPIAQFTTECIKNYSSVLKATYLAGYSEKVDLLRTLVLSELGVGSGCLQFHDLLKELISCGNVWKESQAPYPIALSQNSKLLALRTAVTYRQNTFANSHRQKYSGEYDGSVIVSTKSVYELIENNTVRFSPEDCARCSESTVEYDHALGVLRNTLLMLDIVDRCVGCAYSQDPDLIQLKHYAHYLAGNKAAMSHVNHSLDADISPIEDTVDAQYQNNDIDPAVIIMTSNIYDLAMYGVEQYTVDRPGVQSALKWSAVMRSAVGVRNCKRSREV